MVFTDQGWQPRDIQTQTDSRLGSNVVWRPGATSTGNVFGTWAETVTAVRAISGSVTISVDDSGAPAVIPAGTWNLRPTGIVGPVTMVNGNLSAISGAFVTAANAAVAIQGLTEINGIQFENKSTVDLIVADAAHQYTFILRDVVLYQSVLTAGKAFFKMTAGGPIFILADGAIITSLDGGTHAIQSIAPAQGYVYMVSGSQIFDNQIAAAGGTIISLIAEGVNLYPGTIFYGNQPAANLNPLNLIQCGTATVDGVTGKTPNITAFLYSGCVIKCSVKSPANDAETKEYAALSADRVNGTPGTFKITALVVGGSGGAPDTANTSSVDWEIIG
jgi:hypothetical protein